MRNYFNIPQSAIFEKALKPSDFFASKAIRDEKLIMHTIESLNLYAILKNSTFKNQNRNADKTYSNEIAVVELSLHDPTYLKQIATSIFKRIKYQTILCIQFCNHVCFCACECRPQKLRTYETKLEQFHLSSMMPMENEEINKNFNIEYLWTGTYKGLYQSYMRAFDMYSNENMVLPQSIVNQLYLYVAGFDYAELKKQIEIGKLIEKLLNKKMCISTGFNIHWGYRYEDVWDLLQRTNPSIPGIDLISMLHDLHEFETDFNLELPQNILKQISELEDQEQAEMDMFEMDPISLSEACHDDELNDLLLDLKREKWLEE